MHNLRQIDYKSGSQTFSAGFATLNEEYAKKKFASPNIEIEIGLKGSSIWTQVAQQRRHSVGAGGWGIGRRQEPHGHCDAANTSADSRAIHLKMFL